MAQTTAITSIDEGAPDSSGAPWLFFATFQGWSKIHFADAPGDLRFDRSAARSVPGGDHTVFG
ncbi:hypothetical protein [Saccharothrix sp. HUAS TT1]|uniref:hypothetical protein n=1 Tax=unclassified Saccharothrix TaxID=2593673 RepID=UPI00345B57D1